MPAATGAAKRFVADTAAVAVPVVTMPTSEGMPLPVKAILLYSVATPLLLTANFVVPAFSPPVEVTVAP